MMPQPLTIAEVLAVARLNIAALHQDTRIGGGSRAEGWNDAIERASRVLDDLAEVLAARSQP
jgi:hypothetical protein